MPPPCSMSLFLLAALMLAPRPSDCGNLGDIPSPGDLLANLPSLPEIFNILSKLKTTLDIRLRPHVAIDVVSNTSTKSILLFIYFVDVGYLG